MFFAACDLVDILIGELVTDRSHLLLAFIIHSGICLLTYFYMVVRLGAARHDSEIVCILRRGGGGGYCQVSMWLLLLKSSFVYAVCNTCKVTAAAMWVPVYIIAIDLPLA